jgi:hypothetical protein
MAEYAFDIRDVLWRQIVGRHPYNEHTQTEGDDEL